MHGPTIGDLIDLPHLRLHLCAGHGGTQRRVTWAHASDLDTPWEWTAGNELLLKNGRSLPADGDTQAALFTDLADKGFVGLVIGQDPETPVLDDVAASAADDLAFPVLLAPYSVSFTAIGRAVAAANAAGEGRRLFVTEKIYGLVQRSVVGSKQADAVKQLSQYLGCSLDVLDADTGRSVLDGTPDPPDARRDAVVRAVAERRGDLPGVLHVEIDGSRNQIVVVPDENPTLLVSHLFRDDPPDLALLQHVATAVAFLLAQQAIQREHQRRTGAELLTNIMDSRLPHEHLADQLSRHGLEIDASTLIATTGGSASAERNLHLSLERHGIPHLLLHRGDVLHALLPTNDNAIALVRRRLGEAALIGISDPLGSLDRTTAAVREAIWGVREAAKTPTRTARYSEAILISSLRDPDEAQLLIDRVLGGVIAYDATHGTALVRTLDMFLTLERSWKQTARALGIHRQTVVYRMRRIEEISGRTLSTTADFAELWLALRAQDLLRPGQG